MAYQHHSNNKTTLDWSSLELKLQTDLFDQADADGDGCLDSAELQGVLRKLGLEADGAGWGRRSGAPLVFSECKKIVLELSQARNA